MPITFKKKKKSIKVVETIRQKIKRLRSNMLVHSYMYYELDKTIISDDAWQKKAQELVELQEEHGYKIGFYDNEFKTWDGSTGMHLPKDDWIFQKAVLLLKHTGQWK